MTSCFSCKWIDNKSKCPFMSQAELYPLIGCDTMYISKDI